MENYPITFFLNHKEIFYNGPNTKPLVDVIRMDHGLKSTKVGCREGDCGACTLLVGQVESDRMVYRCVTSCIVPVGNVHGKHVVTLECLTPPHSLNPVQEAFAAEQATQCGYCTPGFVMALIAAVLSSDKLDEAALVSSLDGNLCRCTGYHSIIRAVRFLVSKWSGTELGMEKLKDALLPFDPLSIKSRLLEIQKTVAPSGEGPMIGGGTDYMVQEGYPFAGRKLQTHRLGHQQPGLSDIRKDGDGWHLGAGVTASQLMRASFCREEWPALYRFFPRISSTPIRNEATLAGNLVNASPIADFAIAFLAMEARLRIVRDQGDMREVDLSDFFLDYKKIDLGPEEWIESIWIPAPFGDMNFEKVSKREMLDIASVNTAAQVKERDGHIKKILLSAGGLSATPILLLKTQAFLTGRELNIENIGKACDIAAEEVHPISDIRGSAAYKTRLLQNLIYAHFNAIFPEHITAEALWSR